MNVMKE